MGGLAMKKKKEKKKKMMMMMSVERERLGRRGMHRR